MGGFSTSLCELASLGDAAFRIYLEVRAGELNEPAGSDETPVPFVVRQGETAGTIAERLEREGLISDAELFRRYVQYHGLDAGIEAGEYVLRRTMTIREVAVVLQEGRPSEPVVVIREGLRLEQVAAAVGEQTSIAEETFLELATRGWRDEGYAYGFLDALPPTATLEGFLFPDTYRLPQNPTASDLLRRMLSNFDEKVTPGIRAVAEAQGLSLYELMTLAAIVEREAVLDEERALIAGVFWNRLQAGWRLDADPTVQYGMVSSPPWWPVLSRADLTYDSPYNTYQNTGLPPGPICSPGLAAIRAAAQPLETDYFFFLVECENDDGSHVFSVTQAEHYENYRRCGGQLP